MISDLKKNETEIRWSVNGQPFVKTFDIPIDQCIVSGEKVFILFKENIFHKNRNIICFDENGQMLWQVQDPDDIRPKRVLTKSSFNWIQIKGDILSAFNFDSYEYEIDPLDGHILKSAWNK